MRPFVLAEARGVRSGFQIVKRPFPSLTLLGQVTQRISSLRRKRTSTMACLRVYATKSPNGRRSRRSVCCSAAPS